MSLFESKKKLALTRQRGFKFNQLNKVRMKVYGNLSQIKIRYYLRHQIPMCHRLFPRRIAQNRDYIQTFCNDRRNPFHFACRQWYSHNSPQIML